MRKVIPIAILSLSLCSCSVYFTDYKAPSFPVVSSYEGAKDYVGQAITANYWTEFKDEKLNALMDNALVNNFDIKKAYLNVQKALIAVDITATNDHPSASVSLGSDVKRALDYHDTHHKSSSGNFSLSYQLDLFGKLKAQDDSSYAQYQATAYDYLAMRLTVVNSLADAYWQYAYAKEAVALGNEDLNDSKTRLSLVENKFSAGAADSLDLDDARINHLKVQAILDERQSNLKKARTALATMLGTTANHDFDVGSLDDSSIPEFSLDIPSKLLSRRPDLMADEALLKKSYSDYNVKKMAFFPDFTLTAGISSGDTGTLVRFLENPIGALGGTITLPFVNFNKLSKEKESALKDVDIASLNFVSDYVNAVQEVYDKVSDVELYEKNLKTSLQSYELSVRNYSRYKVRYEAGLVSLTDFLSAADTMRNSKSAYLLSKLNNLKSTMALMTAIGGDNTNDISSITR